MNKRLKLIAGILWVAALHGYAQVKEFDPLLDPQVSIIATEPQEESLVDFFHLEIGTLK